jgi:hypothetical protein
MFFSCDYTHEDLTQRPYLLTQHYLMLFDQEDKALSRIWTFDTDTEIGARKDGSVVKVHHYCWYPPTEKARNELLRYLPERYHERVEPAGLLEMTIGEPHRD